MGFIKLREKTLRRNFLVKSKKNGCDRKGEVRTYLDDMSLCRDEGGSVLYPGGYFGKNWWKTSCPRH